jgi:hypothetical protein
LTWWQGTKPALLNQMRAFFFVFHADGIIKPINAPKPKQSNKNNIASQKPKIKRIVFMIAPI